MRTAHIPVTWKDTGRTLRCHPRFREYLQDRLEGWDEERLRALRVAHGRLLASEGHHEEATEVLLRAGAAAEALEPAATAIFDVINRLDFGPRNAGWTHLPTSSRTACRRLSWPG